MELTHWKRFFIFFILLIVTKCSQPIADLKPLGKNSCQKISGTPGPEDFELIRLKNQSQLVISSHNRRNFESTGELYTLPLEINGIEKEKLENNFLIQPLKVDRYPKYFRPHGISSAINKGKLRLYVISHTNLEDKKNTIEIFELTNEKNFSWTYIGELVNEKLSHPNDLFALPEERLLISNDGDGVNAVLFFINFLFKRATAEITYYENGSYYFADEKVPFGNGIYYEENDNEKLLYRSSHLDKSIFVYDVKWIENYQPELTLKYKIPFDGGPDNIMKNEYGFYVASHPSNLAFLDHVKSAKNLSPSMIYKIEDLTRTKLIYSNDGKEISAASTAVAYKNKLFINQVFEDFLLACDI